MKATFFIHDWVADKLPKLNREIHQLGHEIACHGYCREFKYEIGSTKK